MLQSSAIKRFCVLLSCIALFSLTACQSNKNEKKSAQRNAYLNPPIAGADVPFSSDKLDAAKGDTLVYKTGSVVVIPPNAFMDKEGNLVSGEVELKFREFIDPLDFYLAGINMNYDSAGKVYNFVSSGMFEILANKNGEPLFVNPEHKPRVHLSTQFNNPEHSVYFYDSTQNRWVKKGETVVTDVNQLKSTTPGTSAQTNIEYVEPVMPQKASGESPVIKVIIEPGSYEELMVYDNLQFQIDDKVSSFNPADAQEEWSDISVIPGKEKGTYALRFSNSKRSVTYAAKPVLEGADYDKALKVFEKKNAEYKKAMSKRIELENKNYASFQKDSIAHQQLMEENKKIAEMNEIITKRNQELAKKYAEDEAAYNKVMDERKSRDLMTSFSIDGFGIWNADKVLPIEHYPVFAKFMDEKGESLSLTHIASVYENENTMMTFPDNNLRVAQKGGTMIYGINNGLFSYVLIENPESVGINEQTQEHIFTCRTVLADQNNYTFLRSLVKW